MEKTIVISATNADVARYCGRIVRMNKAEMWEEGEVPNRRSVPMSGVNGSAATNGHVTTEEAVCPRCMYGNPLEWEACAKCTFPLHLTEEETKSIEGRLGGTDPRLLGVESTLDEGEVPAQELIDELKGVPIFADLGSKSLVKILSALEPRRFEKGSVIVKQGDEGDSFYIIRNGTVQVALERKGGQTIPVARLGPGEGFGEMALLTGDTRSASVSATTDVDVWRVAKPVFDRLLTKHLSLGIYFSRIVSKRLRELQYKIVA